MQKKILIIDPNTDDRFQIRVFLKSYKIAIIEAKDKISALTLCIQKKPDCIFTEYLIPETDSSEFIFSLKAIIGTAPLVVISQPGFDLQIKQFPIQGYLTKPLTKKKVIATITHLLGPLEEKSSNIISEKVTEKKSRARKKIVVADDESEIRMLYKSLLQNEYDVFLAQNGNQLIELVIKENPDLLISDVIMPGFSGYKSVQQIRQKGFTHIPVIFNSGLVKDQELYETLKPDGPSVFLKKPFKKADLFNLIYQLLKNK